MVQGRCRDKYMAANLGYNRLVRALNSWNGFFKKKKKGGGTLYRNIVISLSPGGRFFPVWIEKQKLRRGHSELFNCMPKHKYSHCGVAPVSVSRSNEGHASFQRLPATFLRYVWKQREDAASFDQGLTPITFAPRHLRFLFLTSFSKSVGILKI